MLFALVLVQVRIWGRSEITASRAAETFLHACQYKIIESFFVVFEPPHMNHFGQALTLKHGAERFKANLRWQLCWWDHEQLVCTQSNSAT